jgi:hypothetical protein
LFTFALKPSYFGIAQSDARPIRAANDSIQAHIQLIVGLHARVASGVEAIARYILSIQIIQIGILEYVMVAALVFGYLYALVTDEYGKKIIVLK